MGCDKKQGEGQDSAEMISIHAPVWGATHTPKELIKSTDDISIHAPVWGATSSLKIIFALGKISIHAPVWGATRYSSDNSSSISYFNPRTRMGCDLRPQGGLNDRFKFQSTHPYGVRQRRFKMTNIQKQISIHAPVWGATAFFSHYLLLKNTANHFLKSFVSFFFVFCELGLGFLCPGPSLISFTISTSLFLGYRCRLFPDSLLFFPNFSLNYKSLWNLFGDQLFSLIYFLFLLSQLDKCLIRILSSVLFAHNQGKLLLLVSIFFLPAGVTVSTS